MLGLALLFLRITVLSVIFLRNPHRRLNVGRIIRMCKNYAALNRGGAVRSSKRNKFTHASDLPDPTVCHLAYSQAPFLTAPF